MKYELWYSESESSYSIRSTNRVADMWGELG